MNPLGVHVLVVVGGCSQEEIVRATGRAAALAINSSKFRCATRRRSTSMRCFKPWPTTVTTASNRR